MTWRPLREDEADKPGAPVSASLDRIVHRLGTATPKALTAVFQDWDEVAGKDLAAHTKPLSLVNGLLLVGVDDAAWMGQLKWLTPRLMERVNSVIGEGSVTRVELRLDRGSSPK